jgi:hypothetical protein
MSGIVLVKGMLLIFSFLATFQYGSVPYFPSSNGNVCLLCLSEHVMNFFRRYVHIKTTNKQWAPLN